MSNGHLTETEAVKAWVLRAVGWKVRDIQTRFDVDPRRLYAVWEEVDYRGTRFVAMKLFLRLFPSESVSNKFGKHQPRFRRELKREFLEPRLPGI
jgi:hypothetical protein